MNRARIALIGAGNFARNLHLPNLARIDAAELAMVVDPDPAVRAMVAATWSPGRCEAAAQAAFADPSIDAVVIAVRDHLQADLAVAALAAGKHVYVEKPLAETPTACEPVLRAQAAAGRLLAVGFNRRYAPCYRRARELIRAHGPATNIQLRMVDDAWRWAHGYEPGSLVKHDVCHLFDLLPWLTGQAITEVMAMASRPDDDVILLRLADGCVVSCVQSGHGTMDMPKERCEVLLQRGGFRIDDFVQCTTFGYADEPRIETFAGHRRPDRPLITAPLYEALGLTGLEAVRRIAWEQREQVVGGGDLGPWADEIRGFVETTIPNFTRDQGWYAAMAAFVDAVVAGGTDTDHAGAADALTAAQVAAAVIHSRDSGQPVRLIANE